MLLLLWRQLKAVNHKTTRFDNHYEKT